MSEELKEIKRRIAGLEVAVAKVQRAIGLISDGINMAAQATVSCGKCGNNMEGLQTCAQEDCPCGLPTELKEEKPDEQTGE